jgi:hypothetical protein
VNVSFTNKPRPIKSTRVHPVTLKTKQFINLP